jgi:hypothetical protein
MKRVKVESVFIDHLKNPIYTTKDEMKKNFIKQVLVPWFIIAKRFGIPKDIVKMITKMLGKGYCKCPIWDMMIFYLDPPITPNYTYSRKIIQNNRIIFVKNGNRFFDFYVTLFIGKMTLLNRLIKECDTQKKTIIIKSGIKGVTFWFKDGDNAIDMNKIN